MDSPAKNSAGWLLPAALLALATIPIAAGAARLAGLAGGAAITPANARFFAAPLPVVVHILGAIPFCVLGAFQFVPDLRRRRPRWHRHAGRLSIVCGLAAGFSGLWMSLFYPPVEGDGELLRAFRLLFGAAMIACITLGFLAIRRRDVAGHRAWLTRGYAIGLGAGTQALVHVPWLLIGARPGVLGRALLMGAGWAINLAVAEWRIRRPTTAPKGSSRTVAGTPLRTCWGSSSRPAARLR
jgi:uncharacterized membrane protein